MGSPLARKRTSHSHPIQSLFGWLVADGGCWFVLREKYCWLIAGGWFVLREKYCWLVADKPSEKEKKKAKRDRRPTLPVPPYGRPRVSLITRRKTAATRIAHRHHPPAPADHPRRQQAHAGTRKPPAHATPPRLLLAHLSRSAASASGRLGPCGIQCPRGAHAPRASASHQPPPPWRAGTSSSSSSSPKFPSPPPPPPAFQASPTPLRLGTCHQFVS
jgi:hypothetical protein